MRASRIWPGVGRVRIGRPVFALDQGNVSHVGIYKIELGLRECAYTAVLPGVHISGKPLKNVTVWRGGPSSQRRRAQVGNVAREAVRGCPRLDFGVDRRGIICSGI